MTQPVPALTRSTPVAEGLQELIDAYARLHQIDVWVWQRSDDGWHVSAGTAPPELEEPGPAAVPVTAPHIPEARVEVSDGSGEHADFISALVRLILQHQAETRFFGREIGERYEEITLLYSISEILGSVISLEAAAARILAEVIDTMGVQRAALWVFDDRSDTLELVAAVGGEGQPGPIPVHDDSSITAAVFRDRRPMILEAGDVFPREERFHGGSHRDSFLSVPVSYTPPRGEPRTVGVINLIGRSVDDGFSAGDQKLITAIASQIGAAVENSRLVAESVRQERMDREMELAHHLQLKLLPSADQFQGHADVAARCSPADSVGGDFYHLFRLPGGRFGVMIGDVSSHGFAAALIMALTMSAVAIHASEGDPPSEVLRRAHRALIDELESTEMYLTLFYGVIDREARTLTYANAGHPHAFRVPRSGDPQRLATTNPPFGIVDLDNYGEESCAWEPGEDLLFLFTDGLSDAISTATGEKQLVDLVAADRRQPVDQLLEAAFAIEGDGARVPSDDRTAVLVRA
ncbi:MAG: GAF domain-containing SpoIIE family protein phosphatase [Gemmatimonadota bacterium]